MNQEMKQQGFILKRKGQELTYLICKFTLWKRSASIAQNPTVGLSLKELYLMSHNTYLNIQEEGIMYLNLQVRTAQQSSKESTTQKLPTRCSKNFKSG